MSDLSPQQLDSLSELFVELSSSLSLALSEQINQMTVMEQPQVRLEPVMNLLQQDQPLLYTTFSLSRPLEAESLLYVSPATAAVLADLSAGNDGKNPPDALDEDKITLLTSTMNGVALGLATALSNRTGDMIELEACTSHLGALALPPLFALADSAVNITLSLSIPDVIDTEITFLFTPDMVRALFPEADGASGTDSDVSEDELMAMLGGVTSVGNASAPGPTAGASSAPPSSSPFANMLVTGPEAMMPRGIELILDIPLEVSVELGRVRMLIKDVLELGSGSIVELDRVAGEPVDLLVNGRLIAKGEVVVIEDNFGIRITEIVSPADRVANLGKGR